VTGGIHAAVSPLQMTLKDSIDDLRFVTARA
jgi:hypothetical protein